MEYFSTILRDEVVPCGVKYMDLEVILPREINQKLEDSYQIGSFFAECK